MKVTIEQLAEKMGKQVWVKGELKRIYLNDAGWNTKKMSTKTFIFQDENGDFKVSCKVECSSQPWQWCKSQEDEVKESVYEDIENTLKIMELTLIDFKIVEENPDVMVYVQKGNGEPIWYNSDNFYDNFGTFPQQVFDVPFPPKKEAKKNQNTVFETIESEIDMPVEVAVIKMAEKIKEKWMQIL